MSNQAVQPHGRPQCDSPCEHGSERADERGERVIALDLRRDAGARAPDRIAAPRNVAQAETCGRRRALDLRDEGAVWGDELARLYQVMLNRYLRRYVSGETRSQEMS